MSKESRSKIWRLAASLFFYHRRRMLFLAAYPAIGIAFLFCIGNLLATLNQEITSYARRILGADIEISSSQPFSEKIQEFIQQAQKDGCKKVDIILFASMISPVSSQVEVPLLIEIKGVSPGYPIYGDGEMASFPPENGCLIEESAAKQRNLKAGDKIRLGSLELTIHEVIRKDPGQLFSFTAILPRVIVPLEVAKKSGLIQFGSRIRYSCQIALPPGKNSSQDVASLKESWQEKIQDSFIRIQSYEDSQNNVQQILQRQSGFFLLVSVIALLIGVIGMASGLTTFLNEQLDTVGTLRCLGLEAKSIFRIYLGLSLAVGLMGGILGGFLGWIFQHWGLKILEKHFDFPLQVSWQTNWQYWGESLLIACFLTTLVNWYKIRSLSCISPMDILRSKINSIQTSLVSSLFIIFLFGSALTCYLYYKSSGQTLSLIFTLALLSGMGIIALLAFSLLWLGEKSIRLLSGRFRFIFLLRNGIRQLVRNRRATLVFLVSLTSGFTLISTLNNVYFSLLDEIQSASSSKTPNLFLADIRKTQLDPMRKIAEKYGTTFDFSPMIRGRLMYINGEPVQRKDTKPMDFSHRIRQRTRVREFNLTYKDFLSPEEKIVAGKLWNPGTSKAEISLEQDFARRAGLQLGDILRFDIQGRSVEGTVTSLRKVDWISMKPNFFVIMPPHLLKNAPQIFLASLLLDEEKTLQEFQKDVAANFSNILLFDIRKILQIIKILLDYFLGALQITAWFCLAVGILILIGTFSTGHHHRLEQVALLKTLGCTRITILGIESIEFLGIGVLSAFLAFIISGLISFFITQRLGISLIYPSWKILEIFGMIFLPLIVGIAANYSIYRSEVMSNLRKE